MRASDWVTIALFFIILIGWVGFSDEIGLGTVAIMGAIAFLVIGLVQWDDVNSGVNWGVVWLYAAAISLRCANEGYRGCTLGCGKLPGVFGPLQH